MKSLSRFYVSMILVQSRPEDEAEDDEVSTTTTRTTPRIDQEDEDEVETIPPLTTTTTTTTPTWTNKDVGDGASPGDYDDEFVLEDPTLGDSELDEDYLSDDGEYYSSGNDEYLEPLFSR